jgi:hypothetical protein
MRKFFEAFVYFVENGIDPKLAKEFAEKVTGIKAPEGEITCLVIMQLAIQNTTQMF